MAEMVIIKQTEKGKVAVIFKRDGSIEHQRAFPCDDCHKYFPESQLFTHWLGDDAWASCEECRA